jgi:3-oxoacyl-[acyl-carrier protein] reductase
MTRDLPEDVKRKVMEQIPCERFGEVEDVVAAVLFLCSADAGYITGQVLHVNGGYFMP